MKNIYPYTKDNFQNSSIGIFKYTKMKNINFKYWKLFYSSKNSKYFLNKNENKLLRISNHWCNNIEMIGKSYWYINRPILLNEWECGIIRFKDFKEYKNDFKPTTEIILIKQQSLIKTKEKIKTEEGKKIKINEMLELKKKISKKEEQYEEFAALDFGQWIDLNHESKNLENLKEQLSQIKFELDEIK